MVHTPIHSQLHGGQMAVAVVQACPDVANGIRRKRAIMYGFLTQKFIVTVQVLITYRIWATLLLGRRQYEWMGNDSVC